MNVVFRADATPQIGTGHIMRCIALAQECIERSINVVFLSHCESQKLRDRIKYEGIDYVPIPATHPDRKDLEYTIPFLNGLRNGNRDERNWIVVDGYQFDSEYQKTIKAEGFSMVWIDDYGHADYYFADIILNQNASADASLYEKRDSDTILMLGTKYALLRKEFLSMNREREIPKVARKILVSMGGSDSNNVTLKVIKALKRLDKYDLQLYVVLGPGNLNIDVIRNSVSTLPFKCTIVIDAKNMPEFMTNSDLAVTGGGSTCWETAFMGLPAMVIVLADNQRAIAEKLGEAGMVLNMGWYREVSSDQIGNAIKKTINSRTARRRMSEHGRSAVDGYGARRVCNQMMTASL